MARRKHSLRIGDYLRYSIFRRQQLTEPLWAVVTEVGEDQGRATIILRGDAEYPVNTFLFDSQAQVDLSRRERVAPEDLPDEVVVEIAKKALLGAAN